MGLYYLNARYYNPEDGRFMTEDSYRGEIMNPETGHLYVYCANNPVNYVDPSGHFAAAMYTVIKLVLVGGAVAYVSYSSWKNHSSKTKYAGRKIISKTKVSVWLTAGVVDRIIYSKSKKKSNTKNKGESKKSKKERSTNAPEWSKYKKQKKGESKKLSPLLYPNSYQRFILGIIFPIFPPATIFIIFRVWSNCFINRLTSCIDVPLPFAIL